MAFVTWGPGAQARPLLSLLRQQGEKGTSPMLEALARPKETDVQCHLTHADLLDTQIGPLFPFPASQFPQF